MQFPSLSHIGDSLQQAVRRYPLCVLVAIVATVCAFIILELSQHTGEFPFVAKLLACCSLAMPLFFSVHSLFEQEKKKESGILLGIGLLLIAIFYTNLPNSSREMEEIALYRFFAWNLTFHLIAAFSTFYLPQEVNGFWQWNKSLFLRFLLASLYAVVLYIGLAGAILAITELFSVKIDDKNFARVWIIISLLFQPFFFLSGIPSPISSLQADDTYPKGLKIFTQYVLLPLVLVYMAILYAYMGKIIVEWELPKGWVCYLIFGFSVTGILALLLLHPLIDDEESKWIAWIHRLYFMLSLPLVVLMFISINVRLQAYGLTPNRYIIVLLAIWLGLVALYFTFFKQRNIILIPISLAMLALLSAIGPWGMFSMSVRSQVNRIEPLLVKYQLLKDGKLQSLPENVKLLEKDRHTISSGIDGILRWNGQEKLMAWVSDAWRKDSLLDKQGKVNQNILADKLEVNLSHSIYEPVVSDTSLAEYARDIRISADVNLMKGIETAGFQKIAEMQACPLEKKENDYCNSDSYLLQGKIKGNKVGISRDKTVIDSLDLQPFIQKITDKTQWNEDYFTYPEPADLTVIVPNKYKFTLTFLLARKSKTKLDIREVRGVMMYN
ncbi:MAG: DUF4153 domain-containing protein [Bacteroidia bacterium]